MKLNSLPRIFAVSIGGSALLLAGSIALMTWSWHSRGAATEWVRHSYAVQVQIEHALSELKDLERGARDYLLTGDASFIEQGNAAGVAAEADIAALQTSTVDHPTQQARIVQLVELVRQKRAIVGRFVDLVKQGERERAVEQIRTGPGRQIMNRIRALAAEMLAEEERLLTQRVSAMKRAQHHQALTGLAIVVAELVLIVAAVFFAKRVRDLQQLVTICAWTKQVRHNDEWISFEEYLQRVHHIRTSHGISPKRAKVLMAEIEALSPSNQK